MSNFELIDDYLANRLSENEGKAFEEDMNSDPQLRSEVENQRVIIDGVRKARAVELKSVLNQIPVPEVSLWSGNVVLKIAAVIGVAGIIGTGMYFYNSESGTPIKTPPGAEIKPDSILPEEDAAQPISDGKEDVVKEEPTENETSTVKKPAIKQRLKESSSPKIDVTDPSNEMLSPEDDESEETMVTSNMGISMSTIQVERDSQNKLYNFHYQFWESKLFLFGPFDESLYEILEIHGDNHALFLYFNDNFYLLNDSTSDVTELTPIRDRQLIRKLKEFRSNK